MNLAHNKFEDVALAPFKPRLSGKQAGNIGAAGAEETLAGPVPSVHRAPDKSLLALPFEIGLASTLDCINRILLPLI